MLYEDNYLAHHGIKGQKWGVRRFQNEDGTLTQQGLAKLNKLNKSLQKSDSKRDKYQTKYEKLASRRIYTDIGIARRGRALRLALKYKRRSAKMTKKIDKFKSTYGDVKVSTI